MRVLVISHNVFSLTQSMGKTLISYFKSFSSCEIAQFYIHNQVPTNDICKKYYRMTDLDAIKSILGIKVGTVFTEKDIEHNRDDSRLDTGAVSTIYQKARSRTPLVYLSRNLWWKLAHWNNKQFKSFLDEFNPDCIFFASGDYSFMYDIARTIAIERDIPLFISCMDDYYLFNSNNKSVLGRFYHKRFMKSVYSAVQNTSKMFCICDKMSEDYYRLLNIPCVTIHTPSTLNEPLKEKKQRKISYIGNISYKRNEQLIQIGRALKKLGTDIQCVDVYSSEIREEILKDMTEDNGIRFHGSIGADEVLKVMGESLAVIHTESFDSSVRERVKYSVSTKIADSLASGTCLFAYGPKEIASMQYLSENNVAICCAQEDDLPESIFKLITDDRLRNTVIENAIKLAKKNHKADLSPKKIREELEKTS